MPGPCAPWATEADLCAPCDTYESELVDLAGWLDVATLVLWNMTGQRYGVCSDTIRPCGPEDRCHGVCSCPGISTYAMPGAPVEIVKVTLDGVEVPESVAGGLGWRLDNGRDLRLIVPDGSVGHGPRHRRTWPCCQDQRQPATEELTWEVQYTWGEEPPAGAARVTADLACQLSLSCDPEAVADGRCQLPEDTTSVSRQGISITITSAESLFVKGFTGLRTVDLWLASERLGRGGRQGRGWRPGNRQRANRLPIA